MKIAFLLSILLVPNVTMATGDARQVDCLAKNIYHEAKGESNKGKQAVAHVTKNRVGNGTFPDSYCKVVYQSGQFSWTKKKPSVDKKSPEWKESKDIATAMYFMESKDITNGALYFHSGKKPYWTKEYKKTLKIEGHTFYKPIIKKS